VWKLRKPLRAGGLDLRSVARRRRACEAELRANRPFAPDVYLGLVPVTRDAHGRARLGGEGRPVDWSLHMRRLPDGDRADVRLASGRFGKAHEERIAARLAAFHTQAARDARAARAARPAALAHNLRESLRRLAVRLGHVIARAEVEELGAWGRRFLHEHRERFEARVLAGRARDGHGDLRLEQIYLDAQGRVVLLDRLEDERLRRADVCADAATLAMDLAGHGRVDLAERFLAVWSDATDDYDFLPLVDFYQSYRAVLRVDMAGRLASERDASPGARRRALGEARRSWRLALSAARRPLLRPAVVALCGLVASGKSTLAERIAEEMSALVVVADHTREFVLEEDEAGHAAGLDGYAPEFAERVYAEVLRRARAVVDSGRPLVVDGCFRSRGMRAALRALAVERGLPFFLVECRATPGLVRERLRRRARESGVEAGAWLGILEAFLEGWEPVDEIPPEEHLVVDASRPVAEGLRTLRRRLPVWPRGLTG
jgi:aminoglycoside phosphotransferase family enzyme/predicted kinase